MPRLSGERFERLWAIVRLAFDRPGLVRVARFALDVTLDDVVGTGGPGRDVAFDLIAWAEREDRTPDLLRGLRKERPNNPDLGRFCEELGGPPADHVREAVRRFAEAFHDDDRRRQFRFLNAYKELHDILHDLHGYQPRVEEAAARPAGAALPEDVCLALTGWVEDVRRAARETEFPDDPPAWVGKFAAAVADVTGPDPAKAARAAERLAVLPARAQGELNAELVKCARRLGAAELVVLLDGVLAAAGAEPAKAGTADLRAAVARFRLLCDQLHGLIRDHDLCQQAEDGLREAAGLREVTAAGLADWADVAGRLGELAAHRPGDFRAARALAAARAFEAAPPGAAADAFAALAEQFADLFLYTDKGLLKVTNQLLLATAALDPVLARYS
ncbi:MAG: hypothetical protein C0501_17800 [Isosphaera sp.]|nr:hypothetical protein [Isosphaera sp.]